MNYNFKLDQISIEKIIQYLLIDDIPIIKFVNKKFYQTIEEMIEIPYFHNSFNPMLLKYFPNAEVIKMSLENYSDELGDLEGLKQYNYKIIYQPDDIQYIPYLEQIAQEIVELSIVHTVCNCIELLPIVLTMKN